MERKNIPGKPDVQRFMARCLPIQGGDGIFFARAPQVEFWNGLTGLGSFSAIMTLESESLRFKATKLIL